MYSDRVLAVGLESWWSWQKVREELRADEYTTWVGDHHNTRTQSRGSKCHLSEADC